MEFQAEYILLPGTPLGDIQIRYYGIIIVAAMLVAAFIAARLARRSKLDPDHVWGGLTWAIIPGLVMARLWYVLFPPVSLTAGCGSTAPNAVCMDVGWFLQNIGNLTNGPLAIWSGGLSIFGAVIGGLIGVYIYARRNNLNFGVWLDIAAVALPMAQAIGRVANFVNQELYGLPTDLPWGIPIDAANRVGLYENKILYPVTGPNTTLFHPLFLYEALWSVLAFFVLLNIYQRYRHKLLAGDVFLIYVAQYAFVRYLLEFLRIEVAYLPGSTINSSQTATLIGFVVAVGYLLYRHRAGALGDAKTAAEARSLEMGKIASPPKEEKATES